jgi:NAD-dependent DNA ligase
VATGGVRFLKPGETDEDEDEGGPALAPKASEATTRYRAVVRGGESKRERKFSVVLDLDADGRAVFVSCNCAWHRREKLRKGPCAHILAATVLASQQMVAAAAATTDSEGTAKGGILRPDRFKGMTFVFTGALTRFTREQAEALVAQGGGKAAGSVSRSTTHLVAGDKAGSKLQKARDLKIPVLTEDDFAKMLEE